MRPAAAHGFHRSKKGTDRGTVRPNNASSLGVRIVLLPAIVAVMEEQRELRAEDAFLTVMIRAESQKRVDHVWGGFPVMSTALGVQPNLAVSERGIFG